jgi:alpha-D-ribose 1-methylphosphonate 5-triphosphate diphosphatase PhnM
MNDEHEDSPRRHRENLAEHEQRNGDKLLTLNLWQTLIGAGTFLVVLCTAVGGYYVMQYRQDTDEKKIDAIVSELRSMNAVIGSDHEIIVRTEERLGTLTQRMTEHISQK